MNKQRQIVLDTETTGLSPNTGHSIIEIGCIELVSRRKTTNQFHTYINPKRSIDPGASKIHGITDKDLIDKPVFLDVVDNFIEFITGAELIIHNAPFDVGFINAEFSRCKNISIELSDICEITDTLKLARQLHPGQRNNLDALCKRYNVSNSERNFHGALLDAEILADVYLSMTGGQIDLELKLEKTISNNSTVEKKFKSLKSNTAVIYATAEELKLHNTYIEKITN